MSMVDTVTENVSTFHNNLSGSTMRADKKWTTKDIPDQTDRKATVTGANTGIGFETAKALTAAGAEVKLACRSATNGQDAVNR